MDLRLLQYFQVAAETGSLHATALKVHVAQPSLSRQIRRLEQDLGFPVFERSARGLTLTPAGRAFLPVAEDLLERAGRARSAARAFARGTVASLTVASAPTTVADIISPFVASVGPEGIIGNVVERAPEQVYDTIGTGEADFTVGTRIPPADLGSRVIGHAFLWAQVRADHPWAVRASIPITELVTQPLIMMSRTHGVRQMFDAAASRAGLTFTASIETESSSLAQALAAAGRGICVLSDDSRFDLVTVPIASPAGELVITLFGVWDERHYATAQIQSCLDDLEAFIADLYPQTRGMR